MAKRPAMAGRRFATSIETCTKRATRSRWSSDVGQDTTLMLVPASRDQDFKLFVLEHQCYNCMDLAMDHSFQENDIVLPITVIEELDQVQEGSQRSELPGPLFLCVPADRGDLLSEQGVSLSGTLRVGVGCEPSCTSPARFFVMPLDHRILNVLLTLAHLASTAGDSGEQGRRICGSAKAIGLLARTTSGDMVENRKTLHRQADDPRSA